MPIYLDYQNKAHELPQGIVPDWRLSAYGVIINDKNEILVVIPTWRYTYDLPGGGIEPAEKISEGVIRECLEETGYQVQLDSVLPFYLSETDFYHTTDEKFYHQVNFYYKCSLRSSDQNTSIINTVAPDEISKVEWVKLEDISVANCHEIHYQAISQLM